MEILLCYFFFFLIEQSNSKAETICFIPWPLSVYAENEYTDRIFSITHFLCLHVTLRFIVLPLSALSSPPRFFRTQLQSQASSLVPNPRCFLAWKRNHTNIYVLPDLQLQLGLITNPHQLSPILLLQLLPLLPPRVRTHTHTPSLPSSLSLVFLMSQVLEALRLCALYVYNFKCVSRQFALFSKKTRAWNFGKQIW